MLWLITLIGNLAGMIGIQLSKKTAFVLAILGASTALTVALGVAIQATLSAIIISMPAAIAAGSIFLPSNAGGCIAAFVTAKLARMFYDLNMKNLEMSASVN